MARTSVPVKRLGRFAVSSYLSTDLATGNIVDGMRMPNDGATFLYIANTGGAPETISVDVVETVEFVAPGPLVYTVSNLNSVDLIGPFPVGIYGNVLEFDVSSVNLAFGAFSLL